MNSIIFFKEMVILSKQYKFITIILRTMENRKFTAICQLKKTQYWEKIEAEKL